MLGCVVGLKTSVTGITIIALGTSLPDTFASRTAAIQDEHADAAIGNVTGIYFFEGKADRTLLFLFVSIICYTCITLFFLGSNSVNVFLGLGLPWVLSSMYGLANGKPYKVPSGNLTQSVIIFSTLGALCIIILVLRRKVWQRCYRFLYHVLCGFKWIKMIFFTISCVYFQNAILFHPKSYGESALLKYLFLEQSIYILNKCICV